MAERIELLGEGDGLMVIPGVRLSLTVEPGSKANTALFEIIKLEGATKGETPDGEANPTVTQDHSGLFHENFIAYMQGKGYAVKSTTEKSDPNAVFSEEFQIPPRKTQKQFVNDFQSAIMSVKKISGDTIYRQIGPAAPGSSLGG